MDQSTLEIRKIKRRLDHMTNLYEDFISKELFQSFVDMYEEHDKFLSILRQKASGRSVGHVDDFCTWVDSISPKMAQDILQIEEETWFNLRNVDGLIESLIQMYYNFDFPILYDGN